MKKHRVFVCTKEDLSSFVRRMHELKHKYRRTSMEEMCEHQITRYLEELKRYRLEIDETSLAAVMTYVRTRGLIDFHYAIHHLIFQMWWAGKSGAREIPERRMEFFAGATKDCYEDYNKEMGR